MTDLADVIPLRRDAELVERPQFAMPVPERLYGLVRLALRLHVPDGRMYRCCQCGESWPCGQVRLACRLIDGW